MSGKQFRLLVLGFTFLLASSGLRSQEDSANPATKVAYLEGGNIWVKNLSNGSARQLDNSGHARDPKWSSSGNWLAFLQDQELILAPIHGGPQKALHFNEISAYEWSPNSDEIAVASRFGLHLIRSGAGEAQGVMLLPMQTGESILSFAWKPDGSSLAVSIASHQLRHHRTASLWLVNTSGGVPKELRFPSENTGGNLLIAGWTSDGSRILSWIFPEFSVSIEADGGSLISIPAGEGKARELAPAVLPYADFVSGCQETQEIAVVSGLGRETWRQKRLIEIDPLTGKSRSLTSDKLAVLSPKWSPDCAQIAFTASPDYGSRVPSEQDLAERKLWVVDSSEGRPRQLTFDSRYRDEYPQWLRDGRSLLFVRIDVEGKLSLWTIGINGGAAREVIPRISSPRQWFGFYGYTDWAKYVAVWLGRG